MRAWIEIDESGSQFLVRRGTGLVTAVSDLGRGCAVVVVEIDVDVPSASRSIRYSIQVRVPDTHQALPTARHAEQAEARIAWAVEWHRHEGVPSELPITSLNLTTDAVPRLTDLTLLADFPLGQDSEVLGDATSKAEGQ